jgi:hypothetical protein
MSLRRADHSSREVLPSVVCLSVIVKPRQWKWPWPTRGCPAGGGGGEQGEVGSRHPPSEFGQAAVTQDVVAWSQLLNYVVKSVNARCVCGLVTVCL